MLPAAVRVVGHCPHQLCDHELNISLVNADIADDGGIFADEDDGSDTLVAVSCAIEVRDIATSATAEILELFFQNRKRSGGDVIEEMTYCDEEHRAVITFASTEGTTVELAFMYQANIYL